MADETVPTQPVTQATLDQVAAWQKAQEAAASAATKPNLLAQVIAWEEANSRKIAATLGGLVVKSTYAKAAVAVLLALLGLQGCAGAPPTVNHAKLDCFAEALKPVVGDVYDTSELVKDMVSGKANLSSLLRNLQVDDAAVKLLLQRLNGCSPPVASPASTTAS